MGDAVVVSATADILPWLRQQLEGKSRDDAFSMPFVYGSGIYFLPDSPSPLPLPGDTEFVLVEQQEIPRLYKFDGFRNAMQYDANHLRPDVIAMLAKRNGAIVGMAGASADCEMLWQIGIDVLPEHRRFGIAAALTNRLAIEVLERGKVPYYGTASSNVASQQWRTAQDSSLPGYAHTEETLTVY